MIGVRQFVNLSMQFLMALTAAAPRASAATSGPPYRMPPESDPHERTFMQWPSRTAIHRNALRTVQSCVASIARTIARFEPVVMLADPRDAESAATAPGSGFALWPVATDDLWCRDSGPIFVRSQTGELAVADFGFNGWGNKQSHGEDRQIARRVADTMRLPVFRAAVTGEGGGIETDGAGTGLAHESCWLNRNRNPGTKSDLEAGLRAALGVEHMIWAPGVRGADITDFHIDALARFVRPGLIVIQLPDRIDSGDPWSAAAFETYDILKQARDAQGRKPEIVVIPEPVRIRSRSRDFVDSYVNYYVCNGAVIAAEFGDDKADAKAASILGTLYPGRQIVSLNVDPLGEAGGGIHCATQQQPAGR